MLKNPFLYEVNTTFGSIFMKMINRIYDFDH